jgi:signal transduction histidine kinase
MMANDNTSSVLIVEDDEPTAELARRALVRAGTDVVIAFNVESALEFLEKQSCSAIFLDYHLPDGDPWAVFDAAELKLPKIPVVLVTGQGNELVASQAIERGVSAYVKKSATCWDQLPRLLRRVTKLSADQERLRAAAAKFRVMAWAADTANRAKSEFLAEMSHEIRTPLSLIIGWTYLLEKTHLSEDQHRLVGNIQLAGQALTGIVNNVLDLAKIEAGELSLENDPFDLPELLRNVREMLTDSAKTKGIELIVLPGAAPPCMVRGDAPRLRQILFNLVGNAIKFTEAGQVAVTVTCTKRGAECILMRCEVSDTGIGIEADSLQRVFRPFTQANASTTSRFGGTGLGLSISRSLVNAMGGTMGVVSNVAVGTTFWFEVPLELTMGNVAGPPQTIQTRAGQGVGWLDGVRVLVVDDCDIIHDLLRRILEEHGAIVTCCSDGATAVEYVHAHREQLDIILIDVQMPILDGNAATRRIRADLGVMLPIIGLTACALLSEQQHSLDAGMNNVITKPFDPQTILDEVRLLVGQAPGSNHGRPLV